MRSVFFLAGDYWHHIDTITPLKEALFPSNEWNVIFTEDPEEFLSLESAPDLIMCLKDPIENNQIPTPTWCTKEWTDRLFDYAYKKGTGILWVHAALADIGSDHPVVRDMTGSVFIRHPEQCPVTFKPIKDHPILDGISEFTFSENDEHYIMSMTGSVQVEILAQTVSEHGAQPGLWINTTKNARICCVTPGHTTDNLTCDGYLKVFRNAIKWCTV